MKKFTLILSLLLATVFLQAQDYQISFAGTGAGTNVGTVIVENLTQGKSISLSGSEVLHLVATDTGIDPIRTNENALRIYPNPATNKSTIDFVATASGKVNIELFDITGRRIGEAQNILTIGTHSYQVSGLGSGIYTVRIYSQAYTYTGKLISNGASNSDVKISYIGIGAIPASARMLKSASTEKLMQYNNGDLLKFTSTSGNYKTIATDIPTQSKTITFPFIACTDGDGNNYPVVQIGNRVWMVENLKTTKYRDGSPIPNVTDDDQWGSLTNGAYCNYNNDVAIGTKYGKLYNWYAVTSNNNLAPTGWHIPTDAEWTTLTNYVSANLGTSGCVAKALASTTDWASTNNTDAIGNDLTKNNTTGFTAIPGGYRFSYNSYCDFGINGSWWSSTDLSTYNAWYRGLVYSYDGVQSGNVNKGCGFSVRCVRDIPSLPTVNTIGAGSMTNISAICGGIIIRDGLATITERGVCYSTNQNPTTSNSKMVMDSGTGTFNNIITGLAPSTTYYLRAYATNSEGTGYGNEISFKTFTGSFTDIEGNVYHTVTIGTQIWMVENLKTTKYRDGSTIPNVTGATQWSNLKTGAYCNYNNDATNSNKYGKLYTWYAVNDSRNIAPTGWHVPTDSEWATLTNYVAANLGASGNSAKALASNAEWASSTNNGAIGDDLTENNSSGFTALPGGGRTHGGAFYDIGKSGFWWISTDLDIDATWNRFLRYSGDEISVYYFKSCGFSVRCLRD